jgi:hypothetical protein
MPLRTQAHECRSAIRSSEPSKETRRSIPGSPKDCQIQAWTFLAERMGSGKSNLPPADAPFVQCTAIQKSCQNYGSSDRILKLARFLDYHVITCTKISAPPVVLLTTAEPIGFIPTQCPMPSLVVRLCGHTSGPAFAARGTNSPLRSFSSFQSLLSTSP